MQRPTGKREHGPFVELHVVQATKEFRIEAADQAREANPDHFSKGFKNPLYLKVCNT